MKSILVVDNAKSMRALIGGILEDAGYSVITACDGVEGLNLAGKNDSVRRWSIYTCQT